jgi:hypothetical protein
MRDQRPPVSDDVKTVSPQDKPIKQRQRRSVIGLLRQFWKGLSAKEVTAAVSIAATAALGIYNFVKQLPTYDVKIVVTDFRPTSLPNDGDNNKFDVSIEFIVLNTGTEPFVITGGSIRINFLCDETEPSGFYGWLQFVGFGFEIPGGGIVVNPKDANRTRVKFAPQTVGKSLTDKEIPVCFVVSYLDQKQKQAEKYMLAGALAYDQNRNLTAMTQPGIVILESTTLLQKILNIIGWSK